MLTDIPPSGAVNTDLWRLCKAFFALFCAQCVYNIVNQDCRIEVRDLRAGKLRGFEVRWWKIGAFYALVFQRLCWWSACRSENYVVCENAENLEIIGNLDGFFKLGFVLYWELLKNSWWREILNFNSVYRVDWKSKKNLKVVKGRSFRSGTFYIFFGYLVSLL